MQKGPIRQRAELNAASGLLSLLLGCVHGSPVAPQAHSREPAQRAVAQPAAAQPAGAQSAVAQPAAAQPAPPSTSPAVELIALAELPRNDATTGLSGTVFDARSRSLLALQDTQPQLVELQASADFRSWTVGDVLPLRGRPDATWDGEGLARAGDELFVVAVESTARVERFSLNGEYRGLLSEPAHYRAARNNKGIEALAADPSGRFLFFANEAALIPDGPLPTRSHGTTVRIVRRKLAAPSADDERLYQTDPLAAAGGDDGELGVSDLAALSDRVLLVLERGYQRGYGNSVRIFRVDFTAPGTAPLPKTLVVDVATLPAAGVAYDSPQPNPLLENYEALSVGPQLPDGRVLLLLTSDDNARSDQRARILVVAVAPQL